jgi:hypothetical protein
MQHTAKGAAHGRDPLLCIGARQRGGRTAKEGRTAKALCRTTKEAARQNMG